MLPGHLKVCLFRPEIPQNTGNIGRLCAATGSRLLLVRPFGFSEDDKNLLRPGLDYWPFLDMEIHDSIGGILDRHSPNVAFFSKNATKTYLSMPPSVDVLIFGQETCGLPNELRESHGEYFYKIPMFHEGVRSLNLANAASIVLYHQMQNRSLFEDLSNE